ncbi:holo-ACP synthase [Actinomyces minihominis]|uniref:holo-ACP synthase n=1 Tax=Actinomyces minihominis TaxID=2002838 RepID=UPI000C079E4B|nr:holo-ACP synthase [Actinomyces minihominis]
MTPQPSTPALPVIPGVLGVGTDLVHVPTFKAQLELPGSQFSQPGAVFTSRELRRAAARAQAKGDSLAQHLAALWAIKEAALKAWVGALERLSRPLPLADQEINWAQFSITHTPSGAPALHLLGTVEAAFTRDFTTGTTWTVSASHDGDYATALAVLSAPSSPPLKSS